MQINKYNAQRTSVAGKIFHSKREAHRYGNLRLLERNGLIQGLQTQVMIPIVINGVSVCKFIADFTYYEAGKYIVEDCKGFRTPVYKLKKKILAAQGTEIRET